MRTSASALQQAAFEADIAMLGFRPERVGLTIHSENPDIKEAARHLAFSGITEEKACEILAIDSIPGASFVSVTPIPSVQINLKA